LSKSKACEAAGRLPDARGPLPCSNRRLWSIGLISRQSSGAQRVCRYCCFIRTSATRYLLPVHLRFSSRPRESPGICSSPRRAGVRVLKCRLDVVLGDETVDVSMIEPASGLSRTNRCRRRSGLHISPSVGRRDGQDVDAAACRFASRGRRTTHNIGVPECDILPIVAVPLFGAIRSQPHPHRIWLLSLPTPLPHRSASQVPAPTAFSTSHRDGRNRKSIHVLLAFGGVRPPHQPRLLRVAVSDLTPHLHHSRSGPSPGTTSAMPADMIFSCSRHS